ncbi:TetR family transcriptional regulator [Streptomyces sp. NPDC048251]|uniref:TetR family transcriptional regulator n=1 Tax=Streptomyces sp. NPDC048251 TaxID=3154501 RepID=UPI00342D3BEC
MARSTRQSEPDDAESSLCTAELLFAEHGIHSASDPSTTAELVLAITGVHARQIEQRRAPMVAEAAGSTELRDWVACLVRPVTEHLEALGNPTWYARFCAQLLKDPALHDTTVDVSVTSSASLRPLLQGLELCLPDLSARAHFERASMARYLIVQVCAERESALSEGTSTLWSSWDAAAAGLVDGITGLWQAPITRVSTGGSGPRAIIH